MFHFKHFSDMATTITYRNIVNATVHADNSEQTSATFDIAADLFVQNGAVCSISGGTVSDRTTGAYAGAFGENTDGSLNFSVQCSDAERRVEILEAVSDFCASARTSTTLSITAEAPATLEFEQ